MNSYIIVLYLFFIYDIDVITLKSYIWLLLLLLLLLLLATPSENLTFKGRVDIKLLMEWPCAAKPLKYIHMYHTALFYQLFKKIYLTFNQAGLFPLLFEW